MNFQTRRIPLTAGTAPIDLAALADWNLSELGVRHRWAAVQNVSTRTVRYAEVEMSPAGTETDVGHTLAPGAGLVVRLDWDRPFWWWSTTGATIGVSAAAAIPTAPGN